MQSPAEASGLSLFTPMGKNQWEARCHRVLRRLATLLSSHYTLQVSTPWDCKNTALFVIKSLTNARLLLAQAISGANVDIVKRAVEVSVSSTPGSLCMFIVIRSYVCRQCFACLGHDALSF